MNDARSWLGAVLIRAGLAIMPGHVADTFREALADGLDLAAIRARIQAEGQRHGR